MVVMVVGGHLPKTEPLRGSEGWKLSHCSTCADGGGASGSPGWIPSRLLGHLLLDVLQEVLVGGGRVAALLHQVLPQRPLGRPVVPAPANTRQREGERKGRSQICLKKLVESN